jgi:hypothetical protein
VSPNVYARLVGKNASGGPGVLIDPGHDPEKSVLYLKLTPTPPFGSQMPLTGAKLDATTLACVSTWIASGGSIDGGAPLPTTDSGEEGSEEAGGEASASDGGSTGNPDTSDLDGGSEEDADAN